MVGEVVIIVAMIAAKPLTRNQRKLVMEQRHLISAFPSGKQLKDCPNAQHKFEQAALLVIGNIWCRGAVDSQVQNGGLCTQNATNALCCALGYTVMVPEFPVRHKELCARFNSTKFETLIKEKRFPVWAVESAREFCKAAMSTASELKFYK